MVNSVQPVSISTPALNKIGFAAEKEAAQPQVSLEASKDEFVKIDNVRKGALAGGSTFLIGVSATYAYLKSISNTARINPSRCTLGLLSFVGIGALIGAVVKGSGKKD